MGFLLAGEVYVEPKKQCGLLRGHCWHELPGKTVTEDHGKFGKITKTIPSFTDECCRCDARRDQGGGY